MERKQLEEIRDIADVKAFAEFLYCDCRLAFRPDDDFANYINYSTGKQAFTPEEVELYNELMDECFTVCSHNNKDIYAIMSEMIPDFSQIAFG